LNKYAYILFTRVPVPYKVKTRLQTLLTGEEACQVQLQMLQDSFLKFAELNNRGIDLYLAYSDEGDPSNLLAELPASFSTFSQVGHTIGERMNHAIQFVREKGYEKVILTGSDIPNLTAEIIISAFDQMKEVVLGPSQDGGYYLVGCTKGINLAPIFETTMAWGKNKVLTETLKRLTDFDVALLNQLQDVDFPSDLKEMRHDLKEENYYFKRWLTENRGLLE
jgi:rSAM/selenodomain-associated transferase 1